MIVDREKQEDIASLEKDLEKRIKNAFDKEEEKYKKVSNRKDSKCQR